MRRSVLVLALALLATGVLAPSVSAVKPVRTVNPDQGAAVIRGQCGFPVQARIDGPEIVTTFFDRASDPIQQVVVFPGNTLTLTNGRTGASLTVRGTGLFHLRAVVDGFTIQVTGHGPFFPHPVTGEPGIWYLSGRGKATLDAEGNQTSALVTGRLVNLCPRLA
jgi:hypothetical protein